MGYFSNGSEAMDWQADQCAGCKHAEGGCPVLDAHWLGNHDQHRKEDHSSLIIKDILNALIPRDGAFNGDCAMKINSEARIGTEQDWQQHKDIKPTATLPFKMGVK